MTQPNSDHKKQEVAEFLRRAEAMQQNLEQTMQDEHDTVTLLERLDRLATSLRQLARSWDPIDPQMAAQARGREIEIFALRARVERLVEAEAEESAEIIQEINTALRRARES